MTLTNPYRPPNVADSFAPQAPDPPSGSALTPGVMEAMRQTRPWVRFLAILGFGASMLFFLAALGMVIAGGATVRVDAFRGFVTLGAGVMCLVLVPACLMPSFQLFRYGSDIQRFLGGAGVPALEDALRSQKAFWKTTGPFAAMLLVVYGIAIAVLVIAIFAHGLG